MNQSTTVQKFIYDNIAKHPGDIVSLVAKEFDFSRQRAHEYLSREVEKGLLIKTGETKGSKYFLADGDYIEFDEKIIQGLAEDRIWTKYVKPIIRRCPQNIYNICAYGFTEIYNNAIDHSDGSRIYARVKIQNGTLEISVIDNGVGIFKKIQNALQLESIRESILHLSKGKFTTDPTRHTGEGIFFTSRMFDRFSILSSDLYYTFEDQEWFLSPEKNDSFGDGTCITMRISLNSKKEPKEIFDKYTDEDIGFEKTIVAVALSADPNDPHVSRSQAKRLLVGLEKFRTIVLDFKGIVSVGQAFVDEIFRVFQNEHPTISINYINANPDIESVIKRGIARKNML